MNHEDAALEEILEIKRELRQLDECDLMNVFLEGCLSRARGAYVYHAVYNTPADVRGSIYR
jgi:hypothetical protein